MAGEQSRLAADCGAHARVAQIRYPMLHRPQPLRAQPLAPRPHALAGGLRTQALRLCRHGCAPRSRNMLREWLCVKKLAESGELVGRNSKAYCAVVDPPRRAA